MGYAQWHHRIEYQITVRLLGHHAREVKALDEKKAVSFGSEVLSEFFIFSVAAGVVVFEYSRSQIANAQKKALEEQMIQDKEHVRNYPKHLPISIYHSFTISKQLETRFLEIESRILGLASEQERTRLAISESMADVLHELQELKNKDKQGSR